jgi:hypothetical protein
LQNPSSWQEDFMRRQAIQMLCPTLVLILLTSRGFGSPQKSHEPPAGPPAQDTPAQRERALGTIESVGLDRFTMKKMDGTVATIMVDDQTRYRQQQKEIQLEDLKVGDQVSVAGHTNENKEFTARMVRRVTEEEMARRPKPGEFAAGEIVSIDKNQLKLRSNWQGDKTVTVNEQTEFIKSGQPSSLKELKVGDRVFARGKETDGQFVAARVMSGPMHSGEGPGRWGHENPEHH